jgi:PBP1b-binding outer membrane lipoprotein LpoB
MKNLIGIFILTLLVLLAGCNQEDEMDKKEISKRASDVAVEFVKIKKEKDFVVTDTEFSDATGSKTIFVYGYFKPEKEESIVVMVDYGNDYTVKGIGEK